MPKTPRTPLQRRRRRSARTALYASLGLVGLLLAGLYAWMLPRFDFGLMTDWYDTDWESVPAVRMLRDYISIDTTPEGDVGAGVAWWADQVRGLGLEPVIEEVDGQANAWAVIEGERREAVVLHHHVDVDPIRHEELWVVPPFAGVVDDWWIYGRGAFDMKSIAIAQLEAVRRLLESGRRPDRSVILLATTGEETGSDLGTRWVLRRHPELVERFGVVLTEGGAVEGSTMETFRYWGTEVAQKRFLRVSLCHGERQPLAALEREMLDAGGGVFGEPELVPEVERFMAEYAARRGSAQLRRTLSDRRRLLRDRASFEELSPYLKSFFRNEALLQGLWRSGGGWELRVHVLLLPGEDPQRVLDELLPPWRRYGLSMAVFDEGGASHGSPADSRVMEVIGDVVERHFKGVHHGPLILPTTLTDARFLRREGIPTYGFTPFAVLTPEVIQLRHFGTLNERMALPGYVEGIDIYAEVLERLTE